MIYSGTINLKSKGETQIMDITQDVEKVLLLSNMKKGVLTLFVPGSTGGLTTIEYESGVVSDLRDAFERIAPRRGSYAHNSRWGDGNGFSHVRASMLGPSMSIPFSGGRMTLGTWQQIVFIDFDNRPRSRELIVQIVGEK